MQHFITLAKDQLGSIYSTQEINRIVRLLLEKLAGVNAVQYHTDKDMKISTATSVKLGKALERIKQHEPLQYVLGETAFSGLTLQVGPGVLIPRPETEELVEMILKDVASEGHKKLWRIVDICTGSGCIAVSLAKRIPTVCMEGWDISDEALGIASKNAALYKTAITFRKLDVLTFESTESMTGTLDILVSNPPYVCQSETCTMEHKVLDYEPHLALFVSDADPLVFYRKIACLGTRMLKKGGWVYVEINSRLGKQTTLTFDEMGYSDVKLIRDINCRDRFIRATL